MQLEIVHQIQAVEASHQITVLYACESGSRGWGFASSRYPHGAGQLPGIFAKASHGTPWLVINPFIDTELTRLKQVHPPIHQQKFPS